MKVLRFVAIGLICLLFSFGAHANYRPENIIHAQIFQAAGAGDIRTLTRLLSSGYNINAPNSQGYTTVCRAIL